MIDASRCPACDRVDVPPEPACLDCRTATTQIEIDPTGHVLAWTRQADHATALVELAQGARVLGRAPRDRSIRVGQPVRLDSHEGELRLAARDTGEAGL